VSDIWSAVGSSGALVAAGAAIFAAVFTFHIMRASQKQVAVSQEQFGQSVEAERDAQLPVLMPFEPLLSAGHSVTDNRGHSIQPTQPGYDRTQPFVRVAVKNAGPGIALNIWGIVFEAEPELEAHKQTGQHHSHRYSLPLVSRAEIRVDWKGGGLPLSGDTEIGNTVTKGYKLYAPRTPTPAESQQSVVKKVARLTLTYTDIFGRKHAAIYDLTAQMEWENVDYLRNLTHDVGDLERETLRHRLVYGAPDVPTA
jgi:hypothetical protein